MKRAVFFSFVLFTFYAAAMYRSGSLLFLFLAEVLLTICMWVLSRYLKTCLTVGFTYKSIVGETGMECRCDCHVTNTGKLPVSRFRIWLQMGYQQEMTGKGRRLYGASQCGTDKLSFGLIPPYCGTIRLKFDRIRIYDYLALFFGTRKVFEEMKIAVLPTRQALHIELPAYECDGNSPGQEKRGGRARDVHDEVRQIHEYREGDFYRHIHWNLSARTDKIWIKEYEKEADSCVILLLEIDLLHWMNPKDMDAFYRLLNSVTLGLLQKMETVRVRWYDGHQAQLAGKDVVDDSTCRDMLLELYKLDFMKLDSRQAKAMLETYALACDSYFKLDSELCWYLNQSRIHQFSGDSLEQEIREKIFAL